MSLESARMSSLRDKQREIEEVRLKDEREEARKIAAKKAAKVELTTNKRKKHAKKSK